MSKRWKMNLGSDYVELEIIEIKNLNLDNSGGNM